MKMPAKTKKGWQTEEQRPKEPPPSRSEADYLFTLLTTEEQRILLREMRALVKLKHTPDTKMTRK